MAGAILLGLALLRREVDTALAASFLTGLALLAGKAASRGDPASGPESLPVQGGAPALIAALPEPTILVDRRAVVLDANAPALSVAPGLRIGHPLSLALRAPRVLDAVRASMATGEAATVEHGGRVPSEPTFEVKVSPLREGSSEETVAAILTFRDLTAERRSEAMRVDFVANVSHELRTPLASILGFVETLQGPARNDAAARERFLDVIRGQAGRMNRLVDDLLQLSRVEMKAHRPPAARVDLGGVSAQVVEAMLPLARDRGVTIEFAPPSSPVEVLGDRDELLRLVENLLANAIKYGGTGGRVEVAVVASPDRQTAELTVRDHGPGIAPEHLPRLTERFYRVDVADSRAQGGTGLGLAIVKHIVAHHRGRFFIESSPGKGALIRVRLPSPPATA